MTTTAWLIWFAACVLIWFLPQIIRAYSRRSLGRTRKKIDDLRKEMRIEAP